MRLAPRFFAMVANAIIIADQDLRIQNPEIKKVVSVIEGRLAHGEQYVPNDIYLDKWSQQIIIYLRGTYGGTVALL